MADRERLRKRRLQRIGSFTYNRAVIAALRLGLPMPPYSPRTAIVMETIGRKSGKRRLVPMGYLRVDPERLHVVAEHGRRADWVRNAMSRGSVRIWIGRKEHRATVRVVDDAAPDDVLRRIGSRTHAAAVRRLGHDSAVVELRLA